MKIKKIKIDIEEIVKDEATKAAEIIVAEKIYEAEQLLRKEFDKLIDTYAFAISSEVWKRYELVEKPKVKNDLA